MSLRIGRQIIWKETCFINLLKNSTYPLVLSRLLAYYLLHLNINMSRILVEESTKKIGQEVKLCGWVNSVRSHGKLIFLDLRDKSGLVQVVFNPQIEKETYLLAK